MSILAAPSGRGGILVVRLGAMGDILHTLPAVCALRRGHPDAWIAWVVEPKWAPLLEHNPFVDRVLLLHRDSIPGLLSTRRALRERVYSCAVDFQGLIKSALVASAARPVAGIYGFGSGEVREREAAVFYRYRISSGAVHVVDRNLDLAAAAGGICEAPATFPIPPGRPEGELPVGDFVLASPLAGWASKQWPLEHYRALAGLLQSELGIPLVLNGPPGAPFDAIAPAFAHYSGLPGLIDATRRAAAVVGVDSGPMHLGAALARPGVAIFGPTDPARNGPYGCTFRVLRNAAAVTTYKRDAEIGENMKSISPREVFDAVKAALAGHRS